MQKLICNKLNYSPELNRNLLKSKKPTSFHCVSVAGSEGFEPTTVGLTVRCSTPCELTPHKISISITVIRI